MRRTLLVLAFVACAPVVAFAWGATGHTMVSRVAIENLPAEIPEFLKAPGLAEDVGELGREPDRQRGNKAFDLNNSPAHFLDLEDDGTVLGGVPIDPLPPSRQALDTALRAKNIDPSLAGFLPYAISDGWYQLRTDFSYWRIAVVAEKSAPTPEERDWFAKERRRREMLIIRDLGYWSHFVGDGSQPLHVSVHFNGWGNYANPNGFTQSNKVHAYFEGEFVKRFLQLQDIAAQVLPYRDCSCAIDKRIVQYLETARSYVTPLYELEKAGGFNGSDKTGKDFVSARIAAGASELRDLIVDAWRDSANATVGYPAISVRDVEQGKTVSYAGMLGVD